MTHNAMRRRLDVLLYDYIYSLINCGQNSSSYNKCFFLESQLEFCFLQPLAQGSEYVILT